MNDEKYMKRALELAVEAGKRGDVPIGALVVRDSDGEILGEGYNVRECESRASGHAEVIAIEQASKKISSWRLSGCSLYVTLEPCPMCAGACINSRISRVVFSLKDPKAGAFGSVLNLNSYPLNHRPAIECGVCEDEARAMLKDFFSKKREARDKL